MPKTGPEPSEMLDPEAEPLAPRELRGRAFGLADAIGKAGAGLLRGDAAVPRPLRALALLDGFIDQHLQDGPGAMGDMLKQLLREDLRLSRCFDTPMVALEAIVMELLEQPEQRYELARRVAIAWGKRYGERPLFQRVGQAAPPGADYSHESIHLALVALGARLRVRSDWPVQGRLEQPSDLG